MSKRDTTVQALLRERAGYVQRDEKSRIAQVDAALKAYGVEVDPPADKPKATSRKAASK